MDQPKQPVTKDTENTLPPQRTSIGIKLPLIVIGLMLFAFLIYTYISIRVSQGSLNENLKEDLLADTQTNIDLIQRTLTEAKTIAINLATAVESGSFDENSLNQIIQSTLINNQQIFGSTVAYEPYQFDKNIYYWSPYFNRTSENEFKFTQLGNPEYDYFNKDWYSTTKQTLAPTLSAPYFDEGGGEIWMVTWSIPFLDKNGNFRGVATADIDFSKIQQIFFNAKLGKGGYAFLIDSKGTILGIGEKGGDLEAMKDSMVTAGTSNVAINWAELIKSMTNGESGYMEVSDINGVPLYVSYAPVGLDTGWSLGLAYPREENLQKTTSLQLTLVIYSFFSALIFGGVIYLFMRSITEPLRKLTFAAGQIASGDPENIREQLQNPIQIQTQDELEDLAIAYNQMAFNLNQSLESLEERVKERTLELEESRMQSERRASELQAISEISKIIAGEQKISTLLPLITRLVSDRFGFYHTGIFLLDDTNTYAVLQAASSEGGRVMLAREHKLEIGESGIVGYVGKFGTPRIALDVGHDAVYFNNPDLPETRSEMALPLTVRNKIVGVLDLQSTKQGAFTENELNTMSILADQVAIAIENARLFQQTEQALTEAEALYRQNTQESWKEFSNEESIIGYHQTLTGGNKLFAPLESDEIRQVMNRGEALVHSADASSQEASIVIPIKLRGQVIGALKVKAPEKNRNWSRDEINLVEIISERLSLAIENSRLIQESQSRAAKEQAISEVTAKISSSIDLNTILSTAREELRSAFPGADVNIKLQASNNHQAASLTEADKAPNVLSIPIDLRGESVGVMTIRLPKEERVTRNKMDIIKAVAERVALSAENARLFEETSTRAERERLVTDITTKIRTTNDPQEMIQTAVNELKRALGVTQIEIIPQKMTPPDN
ncbi:MAG: GAF domain-containing protein [Anaerolineales bacterium]